MKASRLILLAMAVAPMVTFGQKHDELVSIQRDVAQLEDQMKQLQKTLDEKTAALNALLQQSIDASNKTMAALTAMQQNLDSKLAEQQTKLVTPVATMSAKIDEMSGDFRSVATTVAEMQRHLNDMDGKVTDISSTVRTIAANATQATAPPPPVPVAGGTAAQVPDSNPPAGMSAELSYTQALGDYNGKKDDTALEEFAKYLQYYPKSANAPNASYYIGQIYYRNEKWDDAAKAFDAVVESYPKNAKTSDAAYYKACALLKGKERTAAGKEFKNFIANYPDSPHVKEAHTHLRELGLESAPRRKE